jgi:hypothetical protein
MLAARGISPAKLASRIEEIGFACQKCGECCSGEDNSVVVFPREVRAIQGATGLDWLEVARPPEEGEWDREGWFHTLEWRLKKEGASCRSYETGRCDFERGEAGKSGMCIVHDGEGEHRIAREELMK